MAAGLMMCARLERRFGELLMSADTLPVVLTSNDIVIINYEANSPRGFRMDFGPGARRWLNAGDTCIVSCYFSHKILNICL